MLYLKLMNNAPQLSGVTDESPEANFTIFPIPEDSALSFGNSDIDADGIRASWFTNKGLQTVELTGNAYVLNAQGKTIARRSPNHPSKLSSS